MKAKTWTHTICEVCWFKKNPDRFPNQLKRFDGDFSIDHCCYCGSVKLTQIYTREDPNNRMALGYCEGLHEEE